jgi:hypothetical protein
VRPFAALARRSVRATERQGLNPRLPRDRIVRREVLRCAKMRLIGARGNFSSKVMLKTKSP